ncbi:MAG TPA: acyl-CoA dehydrogenase family protein [Jatrophihabitantaceae bacterium]|nr:acyl-CoA dehydrogenase family protein [Jatrophihabitantaceae bacterium]
MTQFTAEQAGLRDAVRSLLAKRSDSAAVRKAIETEVGHDAELWRTLCEQIGVAALAIPEQYGGAGASLVETHIVLDELGRTLTPAPLLGTVLAAELLVALGDAGACERLLPRIAAGDIVSVAWADDKGWREGAASFANGRVDGTAHYVLDGDLAEVLLVVTPDAIVEVDPSATGVRRVHTPTMDPTRRLARIDFDGANGAPLTGDATSARMHLQDVACVAVSADAVGAMTRVLEMTVEYSKLRVQFGRPIGSFQALKHRMADLHVVVEAARSASYAAVAATLHPSVAKAYCCESFCTVAGEAIQLHGGIAITWEHDAHLYFKRAHGDAHLFGQPAEHIARMAAIAGIEDR